MELYSPVRHWRGWPSTITNPTRFYHYFDQQTLFKLPIYAAREKKAPLGECRLIGSPTKTVSTDGDVFKGKEEEGKKEKKKLFFSPDLSLFARLSLALSLSHTLELSLYPAVVLARSFYIHRAQVSLNRSRISIFTIYLFPDSCLIFLCVIYVAIMKTRNKWQDLKKYDLAITCYESDTTIE